MRLNLTNLISLIVLITILLFAGTAVAAQPVTGAMLGMPQDACNESGSLPMCCMVECPAAHTAIIARVLPANPLVTTKTFLITDNSGNRACPHTVSPPKRVNLPCPRDVLTVPLGASYCRNSLNQEEPPLN